MASKEIVTDRRKELDKDISSYIATRRKGGAGFLKSVIGIFKSENDVNVMLHPEMEKYGDEKEKLKKKEEEEKDSEVQVDELEEEFEEGAKPGVLERIKLFFFEDEIEIKPEENISPEDVQKVIDENSEKEEAEAQEEEDSELEEEYDEGAREKGIIGRFIDRLFVSTKESDEEQAEDVMETVDKFDDLKKVAEISTKVMKMLPKDKLNELKSSDDFKNFKEILKKHDLIK
jgi:hypothetical protein